MAVAISVDVTMSVVYRSASSNTDDGSPGSMTYSRVDHCSALGRIIRADHGFGTDSDLIKGEAPISQY
jgi:hypothetical protein